METLTLGVKLMDLTNCNRCNRYKSSSVLHSDPHNGRLHVVITVYLSDTRNFPYGLKWKMISFLEEIVHVALCHYLRTSHTRTRPVT